MSDEYIEAYHHPEYADLPLTVCFVRHGQPGKKTAGAELGPGLSTLGKRQAGRLAKRLSKERFNHIYSSDLARAFETAEAVTSFHGHTAFTINSDLREVLNVHFLPDSSNIVEHEAGHVNREQDSMSRFTNQLRHSHSAGEKVLVVCHGNIIRSLMPMLGGRDPKESLLIDLHHTSVSVIEVWKSGEAIVKLANCVKHLLPKQVT